MMGEFQISNLPMILIAIAIICMGVLGYFEIKKLYLKLSEIDTKLDEITDSVGKKNTLQQGPQGGQMQIPPHILEQRRMMMLRQQQQQQQQQMSQQAQMKNQEQDEELNNENISNEIDEDQEQDNDDYGEELSSESSSRSSQDNDDDDIISKDGEGDNDNDIISKDEEDDNISHTTEMTIELDNEFKHFSVKELKDLCQENNLQVSGNKSKLISRLLDNKKSGN